MENKNRDEHVNQWLTIELSASLKKGPKESREMK